MRTAAAQEVCLTVSILDGFVLARSGFHHSVNYRSAMIFGRPAPVANPLHKLEKLRQFIDTLYPGRGTTLRPVNANVHPVGRMPAGRPDGQEKEREDEGFCR